jgi:5-methylcytosine-specific restriction endonuclease McrA
VKSEVSTPKVTPIAKQRFEFHATFSQTAHDKLEYARDLMSHRAAARDPVAVIELGLDALIEKLEKQRFAAAANPRSGRGSRDVRYIPAHVKRAVWKRDRGRCTFVGNSGHCCGSRRFVQFDHRVPRARGGPSTIENVRLLCAPHNRLEAERIFGEGFMSEKRERSRPSRAVPTRIAVKGAVGIDERTRTNAAALPERKPRGVAGDQVDDVLGCLRNMRIPEEEARRAVECCDPLPDALLHESLGAALVYLGAQPDFHGGHMSKSPSPS